jgi:hypothetical protein
MEPIKETVESLLAGLKSRACRNGGVEEIISGVFSKKELAHIRVMPSRAGRVRIAVDSSSWLYYFNLQKRELTEKITAQMAEVKEIVFVIGEIKPKKGKRT